MHPRDFGRNKPNRRLGAIVPLVAVFLPVVLALAGFVVNLAYMELTRTELRIATDSASRAAGHALAATNDKAAARAAAREACQRNCVAKAPLLLDDVDIVFGQAQRPSPTARYAFAANADPPNSVQILGRRDTGSASGVVSMIVPTMGAVSTFQPVQSATSTQIPLDVVLVLDRSGSMAYGPEENSEALNGAGILPASAPPGWAFCDAAPSGSRWVDLASAVEIFLTILEASPQSEKVGMVSYSSSASRDVELTGFFSSVQNGIADHTASLCGGATNIGSGIQLGDAAITDPSYHRAGAAQIMIVLTDGRHNTGLAPESAATSAANAGILIYTITFSNEADQTRMQDVATIGGGRHYHASTAVQLDAAFRDIAKSLPSLLTH